MAYSALLITFMVATIILLFAIMVVSAQASAKAQDNKKCLASGCEENDCQKQCHKYSMWSAVITGIVTLLVGVMLFVYLYKYKGEIRSDVNKNIQNAGSYVQGVSI